MNTTQSLTIIAGPSADLLFDAFRYAYSDEARIEPVLTLKSDGGIKMKVRLEKVISIEHEDGSGHSFNIVGCINGRRKYIYYNANTRQGMVR